jgi:hypothetical protein
VRALEEEKGKTLPQTKPTKDNIARGWLLGIVDVVWLVNI